MRAIAFVIAATDHGPMIVNRFDFAQTPEGGVFGVGHQLLSYGRFDFAEVELAVTWLKQRRDWHGDGVVALDVGANVGVHTITWARVMTGWGRVIAFEPQDRVFYALAGNVAIANAFNAEVHRAAVGATAGTIAIPRLDYAKPASYGSLELRYSRDAEFIGQAVNHSAKDLKEVPLVAIDDLNLERLDFLKVDVERMELEVLEGAKETILRCRPVVLIEFCKVGLDEVKAFFVDYAFELHGGNVLGIPG